MRDELEALGVDKPVIPSVFPVISVAGAKRFTALNGAEFPQWLADRLDPVADDPEEVRKIGVEVATALAAELLEQDPPGLHLYTMNRASSVRQIYADLGLGRR
jgi:methylenetetrahydrofolate reductase (NADPH)